VDFNIDQVSIDAAFFFHAPLLGAIFFLVKMTVFQKVQQQTNPRLDGRADNACLAEGMAPVLKGESNAVLMQQLSGKSWSDISRN
jgi:hypothetical protein